MAALALPYTPTHEWRMDEASGNVVESQSTGADFVMTGDPTYNQTGPSDVTPSIIVDSTDSGIYTKTSGGIITNATGTIMWFFDKGTNNTGNKYFMIQENAAQTLSMGIYETIGQVGVRCNQGSGNIYAVRHNVDICDGNWHSIAVTQPGDTGGPLIFVDGASVAISTGTAGSPDMDAWFDITAAGANETISLAADATPDLHIADSGNVSFCQVLNFSQVLTESEILGIHNSGFDLIPEASGNQPGTGGRSVLNKGMRLR